MKNKTELIFMKWKADLADMDRSKPAVEGNFELLFDQFVRAKVGMDEAMSYLDKAIKAHYPSDFMIKNTYKRRKMYSSESLQEFEINWKELIANTAKRVFFSFYEIEGVDQPQEKTFGSMSASEYRKQISYARSHPLIDWEAIVKEQEEARKVDEDTKVDVSKINVDIDLGDL